jgi:hypothetical protein
MQVLRRGWAHQLNSKFVTVQGNNNLPSGNLDRHYGDGVLFVTYSLLISRSAKGGGETHIEGAPRDFTIRKGTRLHQIVQWLLGGDGDPLIVSTQSTFQVIMNLINPWTTCPMLQEEFLWIFFRCHQRAISRL